MSLVGLIEKRNRSGTKYYENNEGIIIAKICRNCSEIKYLDEYTKQKFGLGGHTSICKNCDLERGRNYEETHKVKRSEYKRKYRLTNKEKLSEYFRKYREENKEQKAIYVRKWNEENKEHIKMRGRIYRLANKDRERKRQREWRRKNPLKVALNDQRRHARKKSLPNTLTSRQYLKTLKYFDNACALSNRKDDIEIEHAIPLSIGHGGTTFENCYPLYSKLNASKGNRNLFEWFYSNKDYYKLEESNFNRLIEYLANLNCMTVPEYKRYYYECFNDDTEGVV